MPMRFSRLAGDLEGDKNPIYTLLDEVRRNERPVVDLVRGNVNEHGILYPEHTLQEILSEAAVRARIYRPDSLGQPCAREAVARYYGHPAIAPERIVITPGSSISYWYCFKLLAEPGDEILSPKPSYPLFDYIAQLSGVRMTHYRLNESRGWAIDLDDLENQISNRTRAIILISPHNPTGMIAGGQQLQGLAEIAARHNLPIISDEVFNEFVFEADAFHRPVETPAPLVFTLNGFSKMFALPGIKFGWMAVSGDPELVRKSIRALELISDTFLPVNEMVQFAAAEIFERGRSFQQEYRARVRQNFDIAMAGLAGVQFTRPAGGFYVTIPIAGDEETACLQLLRDDGILTHPGYYYDIRPNHLVVTFIHDPEALTPAFHKIREVAAR